MLHPSSISIRLAEPSDFPAVRRVSERDSRPLPEGPLLVAEAGGELRAALSLQTGDVVADPFAPTAALVDLMRARARQLDGRPPRPRRVRRLRLRRAPATA